MKTTFCSAALLAVFSVSCGSATLPPDGGAEDSDAGSGDDEDAGTESDATPGTFTLTVTLSGEGAGTVASSPEGIACDGSSGCEASFEAGAAVTLTATADDDSVFAGWEGGACSGEVPCELTVEAATAVTATFDIAPNLVFVTSTLVDGGDFGGISVADDICATRAEAAGLSGTYRAWLSEGDTAAPDRLAGARGWVRVDGAAVADTVDDLVAGRIFNPIRLNEFGEDVGNTDVYTGTNADGTVDGSRCSDWTSPSGFGGTGAAHAGGTAFSDSGGVSCNAERAFYCFGIDREAEVTPRQETGRIAFITDASWKSGAGITDADLLCQDEADAAGLPGTYKALLATNDDSPVSRFDVKGEPWRRVDGVRIAQTAEGFFARDLFDSSLNLTADGSTYYALSPNIWTGTDSMTDPGGAQDTCDNWTRTEGTDGIVGFTSATDLTEFLAQRSPFPEHVNCGSIGNKLACLQE